MVFDPGAETVAADAAAPVMGAGAGFALGAGLAPGTGMGKALLLPMTGIADGAPAGGDDTLEFGSAPTWEDRRGGDDGS